LGGHGYLTPLLRLIGCGAMVVCALMVASVHQIQAQGARSSFDHFSTGYPLTGSHRSVDCASCHVAGRFKATQRYCASCHNGAQAPGKAVSHPSTTDRCEFCHKTTVWTDITTIDHTQATLVCAECHNGVIAVAKSPAHIPTVAPCEACHKTTASFSVAVTMDHTGITSGCATCHNNVSAVGKPPNHVPTNLPCEACHFSTVTFAQASFQHSPTDTNCSSCHNDVTALGMISPPHIPIGGVQCSNCHTNTAANFLTYTMNHGAVSGMRCDACHNGSYLGEGKNGAFGTVSFPGHVPTGGMDCISCHALAATTFTSWFGGTYVHKPTDTNCITCHTNGGGATFMTTPPHIPSGTVQCSNCHSNTAASFAVYTMNHASVSAMRCDACHNGSYSTEGANGAAGTVSYPNHVATGGRDCIICHASAAVSFTSWAGGTYIHLPSDSVCSNCHDGKTALGLTTPPHVPVTGVQCSNCHTNTASSFTTYTMNHASVSAMRCDACHNGSYTGEGTKGAQGTASFAGHVPTNGYDCISCHAQAATTFTSWAGARYVHQPTDTNCSNCHNGTIALGMTTPPHIPSGAVQCSNCHTNTATSFTTYVMSHPSVSALRCDACHNGSYTTEGTTGALGTSAYPNHIATGGRDCGICHAGAAANFSSWAGGIYVHLSTDTNCLSCHNGTTATGMTTPPHIPSGSVQCSSCHTNTATSFTTYTMNHASVNTQRCDSCHNGSYLSEGTKGAYGTVSYAGHVATGGNDCASCHAAAVSGGYVSWSGATYVHTASDTNCINCHNGTTATGHTTPPHIPSGTVQCSNCHTNTATSFTTYTMTHSAVTSSRCDSCHNGSYTSQGTTGAYGTASYAGHVPTNGNDCVTCHAKAVSGGYVSWSGATYVHSASDTNCSSCHNGTTATGNTTPPHIPVTGIQCSNCHTNTATSFSTYTMNHAAVTASRCDSCHNGSYTSQGTKGAYGTASFAGHVATNGNDCVTCHAAAVSGGYVSWSGGIYIHSAGDTNCINCHNGTTASGMTTPPHIPSGTVQCSNCHTNTATSFTTYTMNHSSVTASRCDSCHNGSYTSQGTKGAYGTASFAGHVATNGNDCVTCHASAVSGGYVSWSGGTYVHAPTDTNCINCHNGTTALGMTTPPHIPSGTVQCSNCHTNTATSFTTYTMNHSSVTASRCDSCHNGSYTSQGTSGAYGTAAFTGHVTTNGNDCVSCHAASVTGGYVSWSGGTYVHLSTDTNCSSCHNGKTATGMTTPPHIPSGSVQCSNCHTNTATSFTTYTMNHASVNTQRCDSCHNGSYLTEGTKGAYGTVSYSGHVATSGNDCVTCHAAAVSGGYVSWSGATYVHLATDTNCINCHNGTTATGHTTPPHIPTGTLQCSNCHTNKATSFTTYTMTHSAVTSSRCDSCHNGSYTSQGTTGAYGTASYAGHVPTNGNDCVTCHAKAVSGGYVSWSGGTYVHSASDTNCSSCHNGTTATGNTTPPHIPVKGIQCSNCHTNTATSFTTYTMSHAAVHATRCDSCHSGAYKSQGTKGAQGPDHGAKPQDCGCCHVKSTTTFTSWSNPQSPAAGCVTTAQSPVPAQRTILAVIRSAAQAVVTRTISAVSSAVRSATTRLAGITPPSRSSSKPSTKNGTQVTTAPSIAPPLSRMAGSGSANVNLLLNNKPLSSSTFAPATTASLPRSTPPASPPATGAPLSFAKTNPTGPDVTPKPGLGLSLPTAPPALSGGRMAGPGPIVSLRGAAPSIGAEVANPSIPGPPGTNPGQSNFGLSPNKSGPLRTSSGAQGSPKFDHATAQGACASCHNGRSASGKPQKHILTNAPCDNCHKSTHSFAGARFSHSGLTAACATCHNNTLAIGKPQKHIATNAPCDSCHTSTFSFDLVRVNHANLTGACADCHNGSAAVGKGQRHFVTSLSCDTCHRTTSWTPVTFRHLSANYPDHGAARDCSACHIGNSQLIAWKFPAFKPDCAACHATAFRPQQHVKSLKPVPMDYTVTELRDCTGSCHLYADRSLTRIQTHRSKAHRANAGGW
jgi:hypothetical protein